jgi:hypothetical protein
MLTLNDGDDEAEAIAEVRRVQGPTDERALIIVDRVAPGQPDDIVRAKADRPSALWLTIEACKVDNIYRYG